MRPDPSDAEYFALDAVPHCKPGDLEPYLDSHAISLRHITSRWFERNGYGGAPVVELRDSGQTAWVLEEAAREIRRLRAKCGEPVQPVHMPPQEHLKQWSGEE